MSVRLVGSLKSPWPAIPRPTISWPIFSTVLRLTDFLTITLVGLIARKVQHVFGLQSFALDRCFYASLLAASVFVAVEHASQVYEIDNMVRRRWQISRLTFVWFSTVSLGVMAIFLARTSDFYPRVWMLSWVSGSYFCLLCARLVEMAGVRRLWRAGHFAQNVVILGAGPVGRHMIETMLAQDDGGVRILGVFDEDSARHGETINGVSVVGNLDDLLAYAQSQPVDQVILAMDLGDTAAIDAARRRLMVLPVHLGLGMSVVNAELRLVRFGHAAGVPVAYLANKPLEHWSALLKRMEDIFVVGVLSLLILPVFLAIAVMIKLDSRGPVFFVQKRYGLNNKIIGVLKFRTMYHEQTDHKGETLTLRNDPRITRIGRILRRYSLDELPQFINVLRGDMSLVGPRPHPILAKAADLLYEEAVSEYAVRQRVKPGITGWAQVNGWRGETDTYEKIRKRVEFDLYYIDHWSIWLDAKIILMSFRAVLGLDNAF